MEMVFKEKLGVFTWFGYRIPIQERANLIRETGFETVLLWWDDSFVDVEGLTKEEQASIFRKAGLDIENAHLQFNAVNDLWLDTQDGQTVFENYLLDIDGLAEHGINIAVIHLSNGLNAPPISDIGMNRVRKLVERAEKKGVRIAVENVRNTHILNHVLDSIESPMLGLCYDSGHDYIWSPVPYELLDKYKNRIFALHLHDNMGRTDDHLAPGKGKVNWNAVRIGIENSAYQGSYTLEIDGTEIFTLQTPQEYLLSCFEYAVAVL